MTPDELLSEIERQVGDVRMGGGQPIAVELGQTEYELVRGRIQDGQLELTEEIQASTEPRHLETFRLRVARVDRPRYLRIAARPRHAGEEQAPAEDHHLSDG